LCAVFKEYLRRGNFIKNKGLFLIVLEARKSKAEGPMFKESLLATSSLDRRAIEHMPKRGKRSKITFLPGTYSQDN
jgi:hypothetical protein